jgi:hypothetical protein
MADDAVNVQVGATDTGLKATMEGSAASVKQSSDTMMSSIASMVAAVTGGMTKLDASVSTSANHINEKLEGIASSINKIKSFMSTVAEVAMLGFVGDKVLDLAHEYAELGSAAEHMAQQTGMSTDAVQEWNYVGRTVHVTSEQMNQGIERLSRTLLLAQQGSTLAASALKSVGIEEKEIKNITLEETLNKIADAFHSHANGAEKEAIAMQLMRGAGAELIPVFNKGSEGIDQLRQKAHELGVVLNEEDVQAASALHSQILDMTEQTHALGMKLGAELTPALSAIATAINHTTSQGGLMSNVVRGIAEELKVLISIAITAIAAIKQLGEVLEGIVLGVIEGAKSIGSFAKGVWDFAHGNFEAVGQDMEAVKLHASNIGGEFALAGQKVQQTGQQWLDTMRTIWGEEKKHTADVGDGPSNKLPKLPVYKAGPKGTDDAAKIAAARLALEKAMDQAEYNMQKVHLDEAQKLYDDAYANGLVSLKEYYDASLSVQQANLQAQISMRQKEVAEAQKAEAVAEAHRGSKGGEVALLEARTRLVTVTGQLRIAEEQLATSADENARKRMDAERKLNDQLQKDSIDTRQKIATDDINDTRALIESKLAMNMMQKEEALALERDLVAQQYQIDRDALQKQLELVNNEWYKDPVQIAKINNQLLQLDRQYQSDLLKNAIETTQEINGAYTRMIDGIKGAFTDGISAMLDGTKSFSDGLRGIFFSILQAFDKMIAEKITKWIMGEFQQTYASLTGNATRTTSHVVSEATQTSASAAGNAARTSMTVAAQTAMTGATVAGNVARQTSDWEAATESVASTVWAAVKNIATAAWEAAASVYASIAAIPYVGPFLAPAMAIGAAATVIGFIGHIASAEGGYDIPPGVNPITQLHEQEMVLPKSEANVVRNMASMAQSQTNSGQGDLHVHIHAMDANSFEKRLMQAGGTLQAMLREAQRNGVAGELRGTWGAI